GLQVPAHDKRLALTSGRGRSTLGLEGGAMPREAENSKAGLPWRGLLVGGVAVAAAAAMLVRPRFGQDVTYHDFADQRPCCGMPHFLNVVSNLPLLVVGTLGLAWIKQCRQPFPAQPAWLNPYAVFFLGIGLTAFGSGYYHLDPANDRLTWDR